MGEYQAAIIKMGALQTQLGLIQERCDFLWYALNDQEDFDPKMMENLIICDGDTEV